jgi:hypothetical protein
MLPGFLSSFILPYTIPQLLLCFAKLLIIYHLSFHLHESQERYFCTKCPALHLRR